MVPATFALPYTATITAREPTSFNVDPAAIERPRSGMTTISGAPGGDTSTVAGTGCPHQLPNVRVEESNVETPQSRMVVASVVEGSSPAAVGSKFVGVYAKARYGGGEHDPETQLFVVQSPLAPQCFPSAHFGQVPPQSMSDSEPLSTPSVHSGAVHTLAVQ
jgi:hypothetical protein